MAIEKIRRSDMSQKVIEPGTGARVRVMFADPSRPDLRADLTDDEVKKLFPWASPVVPRPRGERRFADDD